MKRYFVFISLFLLSIFSFSQNMKKPDYVHNYERIYDEALVAYDSGLYGDALNLAEKAKNARKYTVNYEIFTLENALKASDVKKKGDSLEDILKILEEREDFDAISIIKRNFFKYGKERFDDSKESLLSFIRSNAAFPEADALIGKIYCLEGEYELAYKYYFQAYENERNLDIKDEKYSILYELANVSLLLKKSLNIE